VAKGNAAACGSKLSLALQDAEPREVVPGVGFLGTRRKKLEHVLQRGGLMGMFDELVQFNAAPKTEKHLTEEEEKMEVVVRAFVIAERRFKKLDEHPRK
jgi:hypothetical protein